MLRTLTENEKIKVLHVLQINCLSNILSTIKEAKQIHSADEIIKRNVEKVMQILISMCSDNKYKYQEPPFVYLIEKKEDIQKCISAYVKQVLQFLELSRKPDIIENFTKILAEKYEFSEMNAMLKCLVNSSSYPNQNLENVLKRIEDVKIVNYVRGFAILENASAAAQEEANDIIGKPIFGKLNDFLNLYLRKESKKNQPNPNAAHDSFSYGTNNFFNKKEAQQYLKQYIAGQNIIVEEDYKDEDGFEILYNSPPASP